MEQYICAMKRIKALGKTNKMTIHHQMQNAVRTLSQAFAPLDCRIQAAHKGSFSFTLVDKAGIAQYSQRLYPGQYSNSSLEQVIARTKQSLTV